MIFPIAALVLAAAPPGVVIAHQAQETGQYIGSPSIVILPGGEYVASHDLFGPKASNRTSAVTRVFRSRDRGRTWTKSAELTDQFWSALFVHGKALYLMGTTHEDGYVVIRRSRDGGKTWSAPARLSDGVTYSTAPVPVVEHQGRLWRAMELHPPGQWGGFLAMLLSAPVDADLMDPKSWTMTPKLEFPADGKEGICWLEGNAVVGPGGRMMDVLRVDNIEKAAVLELEGGRLVWKGMVAFPGGAKKFTIRWDPKSKRYWTLSNPALPEYPQSATTPASVRNTLVLMSSADLREWRVERQVLHHPDPLAHAFQYVDWQFDGQDIVVASRTAWDDDAGGAHNFHDANFLTFHRVERFRGEAQGAWHRRDRCCRVRVTVDTGRVARVPVTAPMDLGAVDAGSVVVVGERGAVAARVSESMERGEAGRVWWLAERAGAQEYFVYFNRGVGRTRIARREAIGNGDNFFYNRREGLDPLGVGMKNDQPLAVDWDGDGRTDLLQRNLYSATYGEPWWGLYFWRNIGTNAEPKFDGAVRLKADGRVIEDVYASYQLVDWDGDGRMDILCGTGGGKERGRLKVFRNTGARDALGLPVLQAGPNIEWHGGGDLTYGMRLAGNPLQLFTLRMKVQYFPAPEVNCTWFRHARQGDQFGEPQALELAGETVYPDWPTEFYDVNGDGLADVVGAGRDMAGRPLKSCVVAWENTGTREKARYTGPARCWMDVSPEGYAVPTAGLGGLLVTRMGGWLERFVDGRSLGLLQARGMPCSSGGYSSVEVADWEGDGDLDFLVGNEVGFVQLMENRGDGTFATPRKIALTNGEAMYAARWQFIDDADPERPLGQSKPTYVDWDGDGDLDMLVGNNSNRIAYFENVGTRRAPRFAPLRKLVHDGGEYFSFRARPAVVDWDGDGLADLVTGSVGARERNDNPWITVSLYRRYRAADGSLRLHGPVALRMEDGTELRTPIPYQHGFEVADWDGDGDFDLLVNQDRALVLYRNVGSNAAPRFRREMLRMFGEKIEIGLHETSLKAVDWDGDGQLDLITGGESGRIYYFQRGALESVAAPVVRVGRVETGP